MALHLLNILPSSEINNTIPYTRLFGTTPDYRLLRTFGCLCYPHLDTTHKLEPRATPSISLGHTSNHRGYRCLDLNTNKIIISRHVTFDETVFSFGFMTPTSPPSYTFLDRPTNVIFHIIRLSPTATDTHHPIPHTTDPVSPVSSGSTQQESPPNATPQTYTPQPNTSETPQSQPNAPQTQPTINTNQQPQPTHIVNSYPMSVHPMVTRFRVRTNRPTERLNLHVSTISPLPKSYTDAFNDPNWQNSMNDEYSVLIKNNPLLCPRPTGNNIVRCMWLFCHKYLADCTLSRYKARLVANGSTQLEGIDLDVKNAFLHDALSETVYMHQPPGFQDSAHPDYVYLLQRHGTDIAYLLLYVDDIVLTASSDILLQQIIASLHQEFSMSDLGSLNYFMGISVTRDSSEMILSQRNAEAAYRGVANAVAETYWLRNLLTALHTPLSSATLVYRDNVSAVYLSYNLVRVLHVSSRYQYANIFTKGLLSTLFEEFRASLSVRCPLAQTAKEC
ncbi:ribonuclease H-like domain-containing protein [Tanacetum coccineum]